MFHVEFFRDVDRQTCPHRINSFYSLSTTIEAANSTMRHPHFLWAQAYEIVTPGGDIIAVELRTPLEA